MLHYSKRYNSGTNKLWQVKVGENDYLRAEHNTLHGVQVH